MKPVLNQADKITSHLEHPSQRISKENASKLLDLGLDKSELEKVYLAIAELPEYDMSTTPSIVDSCGDIFVRSFIQAYNPVEDNLYYAIKQGTANLNVIIEMHKTKKVSDELRGLRLTTSPSDNN
jgi:hypothetical protein